MSDTVFYLIIPFVCAALTTRGSVFYEKVGWRAALSTARSSRKP